MEQEHGSVLRGMFSSKKKKQQAVQLQQQQQEQEMATLSPMDLAAVLPAFSNSAADFKSAPDFKSAARSVREADDDYVHRLLARSRPWSAVVAEARYLS